MLARSLPFALSWLALPITTSCTHAESPSPAGPPDAPRAQRSAESAPAVSAPPPSAGPPNAPPPESQTPASSTAPIASGSTAPPAPSEATEGAAAPGASASRAPANGAGTPSPRYDFDELYPAEASIPLTRWKAEHQVRGPNFEQTCWELLGVGSPPLPGLLCTVVNRAPEFTLGRIYRLEDGALRQVWQATLRTYANWLELTPVISPDGELVLHDAGRCESALSEYWAKRDARKAPPSGELLEPACNKRGKYTYQGRSYRLTEPVELRHFTPY